MNKEVNEQNQSFPDGKKVIAMLRSAILGRALFFGETSLSHIDLLAMLDLFAEVYDCSPESERNQLTLEQSLREDQEVN